MLFSLTKKYLVCNENIGQYWSVGFRWIMFKSLTSKLCAMMDVMF